MILISLKEPFDVKDEVLKEVIASGFIKLSSDQSRLEALDRLREESCLKCGTKTPEKDCRCRR